MKTAVLTKRDKHAAAAKERILSDLKARKVFSVYECSSSADITADTDRILVFGGDGTMLEAAGASAEYGIPVLGVNLGNLGFLSEFEPNTDVAVIADALQNGAVQQKMLLKTEIGDTAVYALNDTVIKSISTRPIYTTLKIDGAYVDSYHGDGLIISSPTGSTAYSLSAGGPVVSPDVDAFVINPVCAHSLHSRPLVVGASARIEITLSSGENAAAIIDGGKVISLEKETVVVITKADKTAAFISVNDKNFYGKLLEKMNRWGTTVK